jgi:acyl carrier protein
MKKTEENRVRVRKVLAKVFGKQIYEIKEEESLEKDFSLDNIRRVEIVSKIEKEFNIELPIIIAFEKLNKVGDLIDLILENY